MIFDIFGTKGTVVIERCPYYRGGRKEKLDCTYLLLTNGTPQFHTPSLKVSRHLLITAVNALVCLLNMNKSQNQDAFSTFSSYNIHPAVSPFSTDPNERFPAFEILQLVNLPYSFLYLTPKKGPP